MGVTAAVVAVAGAVYTADKQEEAQKEQQKAQEEKAELDSKRARLQSARDRAKAVRAARAARATQLAQGQAGEGTGGSGLVNAQSGVSTQLNQGLQFMNQNQQVSNQISDLNIRTAGKLGSLQEKINRGQAVSSIASSVGGVA